MSVSVQCMNQVFFLLKVSGCKTPDIWEDPEVGNYARQLAIDTAVALSSDISDDELVVAAKSFLKTTKTVWWPTIGLLLSHVPEKRPKDGNEQFENVFKRLNIYDPPQVGDKKGWLLSEDEDERLALEHAVFCVGGWEELCGMDVDRKSFYRRDFAKAYDSFMTHRRGERNFRLAIESNQERKRLSQNH